MNHTKNCSVGTKVYFEKYTTKTAEYFKYFVILRV